ncbi:HDOD domain-containing protein [Undibacterium seohonense]|jgi:putative nucleotidyltransferase with HDIG domain|uniref:HDOD domain-containing protein n=1 Tax=Undibacterium seohonense TaxID=1344950 RepID=A0ABR6X6J2_9BURK|nr:HDOD domain-containing protein [Undibacterium seohonense]MBC3808579.1 HDOD domain-containing protein [Undibacterium seohonense]
MIPSITDHNDDQISLEEVINKLNDLPSLPEITTEMLNDLNNEDISLDSLIEKVSMDQALAAKVLKLANTSYYGANSKVVTIQQAVSLLGTEHLKNLIRTTIFTNHLPHAQCRGFDSKAYWRHNIATAICAELISRTLHMKHDFAFTAGLLHDIGRLVLVMKFPKKYEQVITCAKESDCSLLDAERAVLGVDHVAVGLILALQWNFSDAIQDAIRGHHSPEDKDLNSLASIVHVANSIVHALDLSEVEDELVPPISQFAWDNLGLNEEAYISIFHETELRFEAMNQILH